MTEEKKQINMGIENGDDFFAHEMSVNFSPTQFIFDFKCVTPRVDPRVKEAPFLSLKHNIVMVDPFHAKRILEVLSHTVKHYEEKYGEIEKPKAIQKHEKENKLEEKDNKKETMPSYFG